MSELTAPPATGSTSERPGGTAPAAANEPDWTQQVTDLIVDTVDKVRDRTTGPVLDISRSSVHAVVAMILLLPVGVLFLAGLIRLLNWAVPGDVWFIYAGLGTLFVLIGVLLWSKRSPRSH
jgi:hypothetical protein